MKAALEKLYFSPIFSEAKCENSGAMGIVYSGVNLAVWGTVAGVVAHVAGSKKAVWWGVGAFGALVAAEILFGCSGPSTNVHSIAMTAATGSPPVAETLIEGYRPAVVAPVPVNTFQSAGYTELDNENFGAMKNGFTNE